MYIMSMFAKREDYDKAVAQHGSCYATKEAVHDEGLCNFCVDRDYERVWVLRSQHPSRRLVVTLCEACAASLVGDLTA